MDQESLFVLGSELTVEYDKVRNTTGYRPDHGLLEKTSDRLSARVTAAAPGELLVEAIEDLIAVLWQLAWALSRPAGLPIEFAGFLQKLKVLTVTMPEWQRAAYEAVAVEVLPGLLAAWVVPGKTVGTAGGIEDLDADLQKLLRDVDNVAVSFTGAQLTDDARMDGLFFIFIDWYRTQQWLQTNQSPSSSLIFDRLRRERWQRRFRRYRSYKPTGKRVLLTYSQSLDFSVRLNTNWFLKVVEKAANAEGKTSELICRELADLLEGLDGQAAPRLPTTLAAPTDLLKALLGYIKVTNAGQKANSRFDIDNPRPEEWWDLVDLLNEFVQDAGDVCDPGGAAITGADALVSHGEPNVDLVTPVLPSRLLALLNRDVNVAWYKGNPGARTLEFGKPADVGKLLDPKVRHPEVHNTIVSFAPGAKIVYCRICGAGVRPQYSDRGIVRNRFRYYLPDGRVDRAWEQQNAPFKVRGLFGFDSSINTKLSPDCHALAGQAANRGYDIVVIAGLQSLHPSVRTVTEEEIALLCSGEKKPSIHVEISGAAGLDWVLGPQVRHFIDSLSMGEEVPDVAAVALGPAKLAGVKSALTGEPATYLTAVLALEAACELNMWRLYIHDTDLDIIVRRGRLSDAEIMKEIRADIIAKWVVLRKLMGRGRISLNEARDTSTQVKEEGLWALTETMDRLAALAALSQSAVTPWGRQGAGITGPRQATPPRDWIYLPLYDCTVILVPVRWVYGALQDQLRIVGAGDTTSVVSAVLVI